MTRVREAKIEGNSGCLLVASRDIQKRFKLHVSTSHTTDRCLWKFVDHFSSMRRLSNIQIELTPDFVSHLATRCDSPTVFISGQGRNLVCDYIKELCRIPQDKEVQTTSLQFGTELGLCGSNFKTPVIFCVRISHYKQKKRHLLTA